MYERLHPLHRDRRAAVVRHPGGRAGRGGGVGALRAWLPGHWSVVLLFAVLIKLFLVKILRAMRVNSSTRREFVLRTLRPSWSALPPNHSLILAPAPVGQTSRWPRSATMVGRGVYAGRPSRDGTGRSRAAASPPPPGSSPGASLRTWPTLCSLVNTASKTSSGAQRMAASGPPRLARRNRWTYYYLLLNAEKTSTT